MILSDYLNGIIDNRGKNPERYFEKEKYPVIDNFLIKNELHPNIQQATRFIDEDTYQNFLRGYVYPNMVIMTLVGNGIGNVTTILDTNSVIIQNTIGFSVKQDILDDLFLYYFFRLKLEDIKQFDRGSGQPSIKKTDILSMDVNFPPLTTQKQIAGVLSALDDKIELNNKINQNLEQQAQALFKSWFIDFIPFGGTMPKDWKVGKLKDIASVISGKRPAIKQDSCNNDCCFPIVGASSIMGYTNESLYRDKILVIGRVGTHGIVQRFDIPCWPSDNTLILFSEYYEYTYQILKTINYTTMNRGSTQPLITQTDIKNIDIILPKLDDLMEYEVNAGKIMELYGENIKENTRLAQLRDTLLPKLMSGEIDVSKVDISKEIADNEL